MRSFIVVMGVLFSSVISFGSDFSEDSPNPRATDHEKIFNEFRVNTYTIDHQKEADAACNGDGEYLVVWSSYMQDSIGSDIYGQKYNKYGMKIGDEFRVNQVVSGFQVHPKAAFCRDGSFAVVWAGKDNQYYRDIFIRKFDADCNPVTDDIIVDICIISNQRTPEIAFSGDNLMVGWASWGARDRYGSYFSKIKTFNLSLKSLSPEITISGERGLSPQISCDGNGGFNVMWQENSEPRNNTAYINRYTCSGEKLGDKKSLGTAREFCCCVYPSGNYVIVREQEDSIDPDASLIKAQRYSANGNEIGSEVIITDTYMDKCFIKSTVIDGDQLAVSWSGMSAEGDYDVYLTVVDPNGITVQPETIVNTHAAGHQTAPAITAGEYGRYMITWSSSGQDGYGYGVYAAIGPKSYLGDFEFNGQVDTVDLAMLSERWLTDEPVLDIAPEGGDGNVDLMDFSLLAERIK